MEMETVHQQVELEAEKKKSKKTQQVDLSLPFAVD